MFLAPTKILQNVWCISEPNKWALNWQACVIRTRSPICMLKLHQNWIFDEDKLDVPIWISIWNFLIDNFGLSMQWIISNIQIGFDIYTCSTSFIYNLFIPFSCFVWKLYLLEIYTDYNNGHAWIIGNNQIITTLLQVFWKFSRKRGTTIFEKKNRFLIYL